MTIKVSQEDIARRAYEIYEARGSESGHELEDWYKATDELSRHSGDTATNAEPNRPDRSDQTLSKRAAGSHGKAAS
jgi:hypothetical protein